MTKKRTIIWFTIGFTIIIGLFLLTVANINIVNEARDIEISNQRIVYSYDRNNKVSDSLIPAQLIIERISANIVDKNQAIYNVSFKDTYFGTLEMVFPEPLPREQTITIILSEASIDGSAWTREDMNSGMKGFGVAFFSADVVIPKGTTSYVIKLPDRPLPLTSSIDGEWEGGVLPFCCCSIYGYDGPELKEENFIQLAVHCKFNDNASSFSSSDAFLNEVYSFCKKTIKATTYAGVLIDGYRELKPYEADSYIAELGHFSVHYNYEIVKSTIRYVMNHHTWPTEWILQTIPLVYQYYMYSGDVGFVRDIYPQLQECLLPNLESENGLIDSSNKTGELLNSFGISDILDIVDWPETERDDYSHVKKISFAQWKKGVINKYKSIIAWIAGCPYASTLYQITGNASLRGEIIIASPNAVVNAFYYQSLKELAELAYAIGNDEDACLYRNKASQLKISFNNAFINPTTGLVIDAVGSNHPSLHANMFALDFGLIPVEYESNVLAFIKKKGMACSVYGSQYLLEALIKYGEVDYALSLITSKDTRSWYNMIYHTGSKLATEAWDERIKPDMGWNHAWGTAPLNILTRYV